MAATVAEQPVEALARRSSLRGQLSGVVAALVVLDFVGLAAAVALAAQLRFGFASWLPEKADWLTGSNAIDFGWMVPIWLVSLSAAGEYSRRRFGRGLLDRGSVIRGTAAAAGLVAMIAYLIDYDMSRAVFALTFGLGACFLLVSRVTLSHVVRRLRRADRLRHRVVAVGDRRALAELELALSRHRDLGYELVGVCSDQPVTPGSEVPCLGSVATAADACITHGADTLLITSGSHSSDELRQLGWDLQDHDIDLVVVPNVIDVAGPRLRMLPVAGLPFLHVEPPQVARAMRWSKAVVDRVGALALIALLAPVMVAVAVAVRLDTQGPALYRQRRVGLGGELFEVWKFRSMVQDADALRLDLAPESDSVTHLFKLRKDPRITRVGAFIRRYSLDELPQLFNVLRGHMSLVGPRPHLADEVALYDDHANRRLLVRPGLTGLWQVSGRSDLTFEESRRLDLYYVENWSMLGDLAILGQDVPRRAAARRRLLTWLRPQPAPGRAD